MPVESNVQNLSDLNESWPLDSDLQSFTDDQIRNIKSGLKGSFSTLATSGGVVTVSAVELNHLNGVSGNVQAQLDAKSPFWTFTSAANFSLLPDSKVLTTVPDNGMVLQLPTGVPTGTTVQLADTTGVAGVTGKEIDINRTGVDTITNLSVGALAAGLTSVSFVAPTDLWQFVYENGPGVWYAWRIPGE